MVAEECQLAGEDYMVEIWRVSGACREVSGEPLMGRDGR